MNRQAMKCIIDQYIRACNAFDIDGMLARVHPEIKFENIAGEMKVLI